MHGSKKREQEQLLQVKGACLDMPKLQQLDEGSHAQTAQETASLTRDSFQEREAIHTSVSVGKLRASMFYGILK